MNITHIAKQIKLLILDCDGVLTDGRVYFMADGEEALAFNIQDGLGIKRLQKAGIVVSVISGRNNKAVQYRLKQLGIEHYYLGQHEKMTAFEAVIKTLKIQPDQVAYVGDDLPDWDVMEKAALPIAVANAVDPIKKMAKMVTQKKGGEGAVREVCDLIFDAQHP